MFKLAIFLLENYPYHAAIIKDKKISDLSLLGARTIDISDFDFTIYKTVLFGLKIKNKDDVLKHLNKPSIITKKIIEKERNERGWFKTKDSADYILKFRNVRSKSLDDMNCIEWIISQYASKEKGVRNLKRILENIIKKINILRYITLAKSVSSKDNKKSILDSDIKIEYPVTINDELCKKLIKNNTRFNDVIKSMYL